MSLTKNNRYHHSVSEAGNLQLRIITQYAEEMEDEYGIKEDVRGERYSDAVTTPDTAKMDGWDDKSQAIVDAITDKAIVADFTAECMPTLELLDMTQEALKSSGPIEVVLYDREVKDGERISIRRKTYIFDDGEQVSLKYHRSWIMPGDDYSKADVMSRALAGKLHSVEVIKAYKAKIAELEAVALVK